MTPDEWNTIALVLDKGFKWREPFGEAHETTYQLLLDGYDAEEVAASLRMLVARGQVFGPTPGEIVALLRAEPQRPSFDELCELLFGKGGIAYPSDESVALERCEGVEARLGLGQPLLSGFVRRVQFKRLRGIAFEMKSGEWGEVERRRLREAWDQFVADVDERGIGALAPGRRGEMARVDPLAAIGAGRQAIEAGKEHQ